MRRGVEGIGGAGLADDVVVAIDLVVPGAPVPVVVADEVEDAGRFQVEGDVEIIGFLVEEVGGVGAFVAAAAVVGAAHVGALADSLVGPAVPLQIGVGGDGEGGRLGSGDGGEAEEEEGSHSETVYTLSF